MPHIAPLTKQSRSINPFFATRFKRIPSMRQQSLHSHTPVYARLPLAPITASPVPHLTSLYHNAVAGDYGDRGYPGNCGGNLIKDLLLFFASASVCDPMSGSGTCRDVCEELNIPCTSWDIHQGFDACDPQGLPTTERFDFIWAHPPYWRQKLYALDSRDLSRTRTVTEFLARYGQFLRNCAEALAPHGKLAVLVGDYTDREAGFLPLVYETKRLAFDAGLRQHCTDIVRFSHGASSAKKTYRSSFIPGLHDICSIFEAGG
jgi:hypothetical protein